MEAAPRLDWPLWVAGENQHPEGGCVPLSGVDYLGLVPAHELKPYYRDAAVFVLPARYEPFGLSVLEAALSGCALVLGDIPTFRELWHGAALFVDPDDPNELVAQVNRLTRNRKYREQLAQRAMARAGRFRLEHTLGGYLDIYNDLLGRAGIGKAVANDHRGIRK
jgi:glycosyltransferase involved in cell wall biosynthesis